MDRQKNLQKIREWERELKSANPTRAAKLTSAIVKLKATVFDNQ